MPPDECFWHVHDSKSGTDHLRRGYQIQQSSPTRRSIGPKSPNSAVSVTPATSPDYLFISISSRNKPRLAIPDSELITSVFLPAGDIPRFVALGSVALGITGQDVIAESTHSEMITELLPLSFGKCKLQVQVPVQSPYQTIEELSGKRIATSFEVLAGELFRGVDKVQKKGEETSIEYVGGSVEAACALGMADGIGK